MKNFKWILIVGFVLIAAVIFGYAYTILKDRYGHNPSGNFNVNRVLGVNESNSVLGNQNGNAENLNQNENGNENLNQNGNDNTGFNTNSSDKNVTGKDCDNDCSRFRGNQENYKYCQEVCGDIPVSKKNSEEDCTNLTGLEMDYCLRDLAVSKQDTTICDKISDSKLKTTCRNRVAEELLN